MGFKFSNSVAFALSVCLALPSSALAGGAARWINPGEGSWIISSNWSTDQVPGTVNPNSAIVANGGTARVNGAVPPTAGPVAIDQGALVVDNAGELRGAFSSVATDPASIASITVSGSGSLLSFETGFRLARQGAGTLLVEDGGVLETNTSDSLTTVLLAELPGSTATATITGAGSVWRVNRVLDVARAPFSSSGGTALLTVSDGGMLVSEGGVLGRGVDSNAEVIVTGAGSRWDAGDLDIIVGGSNNTPASMTVVDGGAISARDVVLTPNSTAGLRRLLLGSGEMPGLLDVDRVRSWSSAVEFVIDHDRPDYWLTRDGTETGAPVELRQDLRVRHTGPGTTVLAGSSEFIGPIDVEAGSFIVAGQIFPGQFSFNSTINVLDGGLLGGDGVVRDVEVFAGGLLAPGRSVGTLTTNHLVLNDNAVLEFELSTPGTVGGEINDLISSRDLTLDGILNITADVGFGAGTYRLINYSRDLVDNGLVIGTAPAGYSLAIDVATDGEVNLVVGTDGGDVSALFLPEQLSFVNVQAGNSGDPEPLLLTGRGADPLVVQQVVLAGSNADAFQITQDACTGQSLNQNQSCDLAVTFSPGTLGLKFARLEVETNAAESPLVTPMSGIAVAADSLFADSFE